MIRHIIRLLKPTKCAVEDPDSRLSPDLSLKYCNYSMIMMDIALLFVDTKHRSLVWRKRWTTRKKDNETLIEFWNTVFAMSEEEKEEYRNNPVDWKELVPSEKLFHVAGSLGRRKESPGLRLRQRLGGNNRR